MITVVRLIDAVGLIERIELLVVGLQVRVTKTHTSTNECHYFLFLNRAHCFAQSPTFFSILHFCRLQIALGTTVNAGTKDIMYRVP